MIMVSLSLIERDVTKISPKICLHWHMRRTVGHCNYYRLKRIKTTLSMRASGILSIFSRVIKSCFYNIGNLTIVLWYFYRWLRSIMCNIKMIITLYRSRWFNPWITNRGQCTVIQLSLHTLYVTSSGKTRLLKEQLLFS